MYLPTQYDEIMDYVTISANKSNGLQKMLHHGIFLFFKGSDNDVGQGVNVDVL